MITIENILVLTGIFKSFVSFGLVKGIVTIGVKKGLLLLLMPDMIPNTDFDNWINRYKVDFNPSKHSDIKYIFNEFDKQVEKLRIDLNVRKPLTNEKGETLTLLEIDSQLKGYELRMGKLKLMKERELLVTTNLYKPTGVKYVVVRSNWLDKTGKKYRKFSKNLGSEEKLLVKGKIPPYAMREALEEITRMMWDQYNLEYPS
jgi:hypothetical protein